MKVLYRKNNGQTFLVNLTVILSLFDKVWDA